MSLMTYSHGWMEVEHLLIVAMRERSVTVHKDEVECQWCCRDENVSNCINGDVCTWMMRRCRD